MNRRLAKHFYWIIPVTIMVFGLALLFYQNFMKVTEPPEPDWSRALLIGETHLNKLPPVKVTDDGEFLFTRFEDGKLATTRLGKDFIVKGTKTYDIPVDKWTQIYQQDDTIIYFDFKNIYDKDKNTIITDVQKFYPLKTAILYVKDDVLYQLSPDNLKSIRVMDIDINNVNLTPQENEEGIVLLEYTPVLNGVDLTLHQLTNGKMKTVYQSTISVDPGKVVNNISFALNDQKLALLLLEELVLTQGKPEFFNYFMQTTISNQDEPLVNELVLPDPAGNNNLKEVSNVVLTFNNDKPTLLFQADGLTETQYNDPKAFNIYKAVVNEDGTTTTERRSNTPYISTNPQWVDEKTIAWLDLDPDGNRINISSANLEAVNQIIKVSSDDWLRAFGNTMGMATSSFFAVAISFVWYIWPILFVVLLYMFRTRLLNRDPKWIYYTGIGLYAIAALVGKNQVFIDNIYHNAPAYLTFNGSAYLYLILFGIISFGLTHLTKKINDWDGVVRIMYFVGIHIFLITLFFGPYII
ncbi:MAG: hypothetical protein K0Q87_3281 [Neobacillus sp.]|jgi:hypothetical protein|nr:hypothetical protein [Neobacillus sp.]